VAFGGVGGDDKAELVRYANQNRTYCRKEEDNRRQINNNSKITMQPRRFSVRVVAEDRHQLKMQHHRPLESFGFGLRTFSIVSREPSQLASKKDKKGEGYNS
jgi:hypothetical protein